MQMRSPKAITRTVTIFAVLFIMQNPHLHVDRQVTNSVDAKASDEVESHGDRADRLRRASRARATSRLGYESVGDPDESKISDPDYHALGLLISRLGKINTNIADGITN